MGSPLLTILTITNTMGYLATTALTLATFTLVCQAELKFGPVADKNHNGPDSLAGCDPDYGWSDGADGSGKCYMLIKDYDYSTCYSDGVGGYGLSWFNAMECCYYNKGYPAEPQNQAEQDKIVEYIQIADQGSLGLTAYWLGGNDLHREGSWVWPSGQPFTYTNWGEGEPNDSDGKEDCIAIDSPKEYKWMDLNCTEPMHGAVTHFTVCERIPGGFWLFTNILYVTR